MIRLLFAIIIIFQLLNAQKDKALVRVQHYKNKIALVIGNENYKLLNDTLKYAIDDAKNINDFLVKRDFDVTFIDDVKNKKDFEEKIETFVNKINSDSIVVFYYSGHGMSSDGINYLLPTEIGEDIDAPKIALSVDYLLAKLNLIEHKINIVILDSCRNSLMKGNYKGFSTNNQLNIDKTYIAYATSEGMKAKDNGFFASCFVKYAKKREWNIEKVFKQVGIDVKRETNNNQMPCFTSSLSGDLYFSKVKEDGALHTIYKENTITPPPTLTNIKKSSSSYIYIVVIFIFLLLFLLYKYRVAKLKKHNIHTIGFKHYYIDSDIDKSNWYEAQKYAQEFRVMNYTKWRLPTKNELKKIYKSNKNLGNYTFWAEDKTLYLQSWVVDFSNGKDYFEDKENRHNRLLIAQ